MDIFQSISDTGVLTLTLGGRLDADSSPGFADLLGHSIDAGHHKIVLDLSGVEYVSSVGLRALILGAKKVAPLGGKIVLSGPTERIVKLLEISGFTSIFTIAATREQALEQLR
jgi:anti-anti-sigma factor